LFLGDAENKRLGTPEQNDYNHKCIQGGEGGRGEGKYRGPSSQANFKTFVNKNATKPEIGGPNTPGNFFRKALIPPPPRDFIKSLSNPLPMDFEHVCIYDKNGLSNYLHTFKNP
jgi:hypothetical protein